MVTIIDYKSGDLYLKGASHNQGLGQFGCVNDQHHQKSKHYPNEVDLASINKDTKYVHWHTINVTNSNR